MELKFSKKFIRQLERFQYDKKLYRLLAAKIKFIESASSESEISELVQIRKTNTRFRIKIKISNRIIYRVGINILHNKIWFACIENDKKRFYKQFP